MMAMLIIGQGVRQPSERETSKGSRERLVLLSYRRDTAKNAQIWKAG